MLSQNQKFQNSRNVSLAPTFAAYVGYTFCFFGLIVEKTSSKNLHCI